MSIEIAHLVGNTIKFLNTITDFDSTPQNPILIDPDTHDIRFYDPSGTQQGATVTNPTKTGAGKYFVYFTIPDKGTPGVWSMIWTATYVALPSKKRVEFTVTA